MISAVQNQNGGISTVDALWTLIQSQTKTVREALTQQQMVRRSLTKAFEELYSGEVKKDARTLFVK